jgi:prevent-host-death family protein
MEPSMAYTAKDIIPLSQARANLSELVEEVRGGTEKIITKNGESAAALISTEKLERYYRMEKARIHLMLLHDAQRAMQGVADHGTEDFDAFFDRLDMRLDEESRNSGGGDRER